MEEENIIIKIFEKAFDDFASKMCRNGYHIEERKIEKDEISVTFYVSQINDIFYKIYMKKQNIESDKIPNIKGQEPLNNENNPYNKLQYSDENYILKKIYENIITYNFKEIVCYEKYGILIKDLLNYKGIYNINIKSIMKG